MRTTPEVQISIVGPSYLRPRLVVGTSPLGPPSSRGGLKRNPREAYENAVCLPGPFHEKRSNQVVLFPRFLVHSGAPGKQSLKSPCFVSSDFSCFNFFPTRDGSNRIYGKMIYGIYTYILVYIHILYGSMKKKEVMSEQEDVVLMANAERGLTKSSPISKRTVNDILVEKFVLPNVIFLSRLSLRPHVVQPLSASKLRSSQDVVLMAIRTNQWKRDPSEYAA